MRISHPIQYVYLLADFALVAELPSILLQYFNILLHTSGNWRKISGKSFFHPAVSWEDLIHYFLLCTVVDDGF